MFAPLRVCARQLGKYVPRDPTVCRSSFRLLRELVVQGRVLHKLGRLATQV